MIEFLLIFLWWAVGVAGSIYWWTEDLDLRAEHVFLHLVTGFLGPLAWLLFARTAPLVLIKRRK